MLSEADAVAQTSIGREGGHPAQDWLKRHCDSVWQGGDVSLVEGLVLWQQATGWMPVALWPAGADGKVLLAFAAELRQAGDGAVRQLPDGDLAIAYPVRKLENASAEIELLGVVALRLRLGIADQQKTTEASLSQQVLPLMRRLEDGVAVLERDALWRQWQGIQARYTQLGRQMEMLAAVLAENSFSASSLQLATRLASYYQAERVSLGWRKGAHTRIVQISHMARFNRKMNRVRATESAMDEAIDQARTISLPSAAASANASLEPVARCHQHLAVMIQLPAILSIPLFSDLRPIGAVTLEREKPFQVTEIAELEDLLALFGRALEEKRANDRPLLFKVILSARTLFERLTGSGHFAHKVVASVLLLLTLFGLFATGMDRVGAEAVLESHEQRVIAAPFRGYLQEAYARAGDVVEQGSPLAQIDTRDLRLEQLQWQSELLKYTRQEQDMRARGDRAGLNVLAAQREQVEARLALIKSRLDRAQLRSPLEGHVVSGDLTQRLGGVVEQGEELFRVSPLSEYRIELAVPELRMADLVVGQRGQLVFAAMSTRSFEFVIERITPRTLTRDGAHHFIVEARLREWHPSLRPGMQGIGKIELGERRLVAIWTYRLRAWLRMQLWRWLG